MKYTIPCITFLLLVSGCIIKKTEPASKASFKTYKEHFIEGLWKQYPEWATGVGYHKYDSILTIPNEANRKSQLAFVRATRDSLAAFDVQELSAGDQIDFHQIANFIQSTQWQLDTLKSYKWDPSSYNIIGTFAYMLNETYAPLAVRLKDVNARMRGVAKYYDAAKANISNPVEELTMLAIDQHLNALSIIEVDLADSVRKSTLSDGEKKLLLSRSKTAIEAIKDYARWLKELKNPTPADFRLGKEHYSRKFHYDIESAFTATQIFDSAITRKHYLHKKMFQRSQELWPKYFGRSKMPADTLIAIRRVIDTLSFNHVKPDEFQPTIEKTIPSLVAFVKEKDLLYIDPKKPLVVRKEPAYMAGVAGASVSAPGPYEKNANTYYNVGSLSGWPKEKAESYLREYNDYMLQILCIHEAIPGHYTQLVYANQSDDIIKSILGNGAMVEGWAVYSEELMLENGYGGNAPEMWMMWYKWNLRSVCNTILDYSVHNLNMQREDAIALLTAQAFQQKAEAEGKWHRVVVSSVQLTSYYTGYKEIVDLRTAYRKKMGEHYSVKNFNEKFLGYGNAPVKYIRQLMLME